MPWGVVAGAVISAGAGLYEANKANQAAKSVSDQQQQQSATIFGEQQGFESQLMTLMDNPQNVSKLPSYQFMLDQGSQTLSRQMAAQGLRGSGNEFAALTKYGQDYASNAYLQQANLLASLSGITAASSPAQGGAVAGDVVTSNNRLQTSSMNNILSELGIMGGMKGGGGGGWSSMFSGGGAAPSNPGATSWGAGA